MPLFTCQFKPVSHHRTCPGPHKRFDPTFSEESVLLAIKLELVQAEAGSYISTLRYHLMWQTSLHAATQTEENGGKRGTDGV